MFVKVLDSRDAERELRKLLKRHGDKVLAVAVIVRVDSDRQVGALARHYRLRLSSLPAQLLLEQQDGG